MLVIFCYIFSFVIFVRLFCLFFLIAFMLSLLASSWSVCLSLTFLYSYFFSSSSVIYNFLVFRYILYRLTRRHNWPLTQNSHFMPSSIVMHVGIDKSKTSKGTILKLLLWNKSPKENVVLEKLCLCKTISEVRGFPVLLLRKMSFLKFWMIINLLL